MEAIIRTGPPHFLHFSISMANTRLRRCAQVSGSHRTLEPHIPAVACPAPIALF